MKTTKRIISTILVVVMCLTMAPLNGFMEIKWEGFDFSEIFTPEAKAATIGYYTYSVSGGKATITGVSASISGNITIPSTLGGYPVTSIGDSAFYNCSALTSVTIGNSVTSIGDYAFEYCSSLKSVTIGNSVTSIGHSTFAGCRSLTSVTIPDSVTSIGDSAFYNCSALKSVTIGNSVTSIGYYAFYNCSALTSVSIPDSVTSIFDDAFAYCSALTSVSIPDSVTSIGESAFKGCSALTSVSIPDSVTSIGFGAFYGCNKLTDVYYSGTQEQWKKISIGSINSNLINATIHYNAYHIHRYNSEVTTTATHLKEGVMTYTCTCGDTYTEVIAKTTEHNYNAVVTAPTCEDKGYTTYTCACGASYVEDIPKLGHNFSKEFTVDKEATYTESGLKSKHCLRNGCSEKSEAVEIPKLDAVFSDSDTAKIKGTSVVAVTQTTVGQILSQAGSGAYISDKNGKQVAGDAYPGTGMTLTLSDGKKYTVVVLGDIDGDSKATAADARLSLRASVGLEKYDDASAQYKAANIQSDDKITASDARLILRASVGLEDAKTWMK